MCGIAGIVSADGRRIDPRDLHAMAECLHHRGPDDEGYLLACADGGGLEACRGLDTVPERARGLRLVTDAADRTYSVGLAHRRLSIIDVSAAGHQPMASADGKLWITYNGEIYNYVELRQELEALGCRFESDSDTEVLLRAYEQWGESCLSRLDGMWAFAVANFRRKELFCARDRLGVKPFYYWFDGKTFAFASEIKALLRLPFVSRAPNHAIIWDFLVLGAIDHTRETFFAEIQSLGSGESMALSFDGQLQRRQFWQLPASAGSGEIRPPSHEDVDTVRDLMSESVRLRLRSDVPVGFCLSGGLDSSSVVGIASRQLHARRLPQIGDRLQAFHSAFDDKSIDEREYVRAVIEQSGATPAYVFPSSAELINDYEDLVRHQDEPFGGPSVYAQYRVVKLARRAGVKVLLDGQGGDELFAGYYQYYGLNLANLVTSGAVRDAAAALKTNGSIIGRHALFQSGLRWAPKPVAARLFLSANTDSRLIAPEFLEAYRDRLDMHLTQLRASASVNDLLILDLSQHSLPRLLRYEDRNSMAFSLESRVPFADATRLIEFVSALPDSAKVWRGWSKYVLRQAMAGILPESIRWRKRKLGFSVPVQPWAAAVRRSPLMDWVAGANASYIDKALLNRQLQARGAHMRRSMLWRLLELGIWEQSRREPVHTPLQRQNLC